MLDKAFAFKGNKGMINVTSGKGEDVAQSSFIYGNFSCKKMATLGKALLCMVNLLFFPVFSKYFY